MFKQLPGRLWRLIITPSAYSPRKQAVFEPKSIAGLIDGIIAIAATLLVIEIHVPEHRPGDLGRALLGETDQYLVYALGFLMITAAWINIHRLLRWVRGIDHYTTILFLLSGGSWTLVPFTTRVLGDATGNADDMAAAVRLMAIVLFIGQLVWLTLVAYIVRLDLLRDGLPPVVREIWVPVALLVWVAPLSAYALSYLSAAAGLAAIVVFLLTCVLPFENAPSELAAADQLKKAPASS